MDWASAQLLALLAAGGFTVGLLIGLTGVGAGSLTTPFLISAVHVEPLMAVGTDLLFACITKASSAWHHHRLRNVDYRIAGWLAAGSLPSAAAVFFALKASGIHAETLAAAIRVLLAVALIVSAIAIALYPFIAKGHTRTADGLASPPARPKQTLMLGILLGVLVALTSVGAGAIGVVVLTLLYPALAIRRLVGTDVVHAIPLTLVAGLGHLSIGHVDVRLLGGLLLGSVPGIYIGTRLTGVLPERVMRLLLAAILCLAAYSLRK